MDVSDVLSQPEVVLRVALVSDQPQQVKPGEEGGRELDVGLGRLLDVVAAEGGVGSGQDGHAGIQSRHDASLEGRPSERISNEGQLWNSNWYWFRIGRATSK